VRHRGSSRGEARSVAGRRGERAGHATGCDMGRADPHEGETDESLRGALDRGAAGASRLC